MSTIDRSIPIRRGDTFTYQFLGFGDITGFSEIWFSIKEEPQDSDVDAIFLMSESAGLIVVNKSPAGTPLNGSITVDDATLGNITVRIEATETTFFDCARLLYYDVQFLGLPTSSPTTVDTRRNGRVYSILDIVRIIA